MVKKIVSGGQTGVDRAALDVAIDLQMPYGGWCPKGRIAEDGKISQRYKYLIETSSSKYTKRTEKNVIDSDATLIVCWGEPTSGTALTIKLCEKHKKPHIVADLNKSPQALVHNWLATENPQVLNIAGPRQSKHPFNVYARAFRFIKDVIWMQPR